MQLQRAEQLLLVCDPLSAKAGLELLRCVMENASAAEMSGEDSVCVSRACIRALQQWSSSSSCNAADDYSFAFACELAHALAGFSRASQAAFVGELGRVIDSSNTSAGADGLLSVCCARLAVLWGRLLTAPKAASKSVLKQAREAEIAVARVGSIIKDAQEGTGTKGTTAEGRAWLAGKAKEQGVIATGSGLMYKVIKSGAADARRPGVDTRCECHYRGTLIDGREFDSSYARGAPATFAPSEVIKGWTEAMLAMREGDMWQLYVPSELAYGDASRGDIITPGSVLVFELELLQVK